MQVAAPSMSSVSGQWHLQGVRSARQSAVNRVQARAHAGDDLALRRTDQEVTQKLSTMGKFHGAVLSALRSNRYIEETYLFDEVH